MDPRGAFHSIKTSSLNFRQLPVANRTRKFSSHVILLPEFLELSVKWFAFQKINGSRTF